jgi:glycosyltransferase involved in cell wall biosynthesis
MKLLFIAQWELRKNLGGPKVVIEIAEAISNLGHEVLLLGIQEVKDLLKTKSLPVTNSYAENINCLLQEIGDDYDIIDVDGNYLYELDPSKFKNTLIVVRSVLFIPHLEYITWPNKVTLRNRIGNLIRFIKNINIKSAEFKKIELFYKSINKADLVNVSNHKDVELLIEKGYEKSRICHLPYGIPVEERIKFDQIAQIKKEDNHILFLGTFEFRKGCLDLVKIFTEIKNQVPDCKFTLLGAKGLFQEEEAIYKFFPKYLRPDIDLIMSFNPSEVTNYLKKIKIAVFPSYFEGFPFSVIECISSGIPVLAYNTPGASSMLTDDLLADAGDWNLLAKKTIELLTEPTYYLKVSQNLLQKSKQYNWNYIAKDTIDIYKQALEDKIKFNENE